MVSGYLQEKNLPQRAILILDNAPVHPKDLALKHPWIRVIYMPPNCSCLIQPMDQAVIKSLKAFYVRRTMAEASKTNSHEQLRAFWASFNVKDCIEHLVASWNEVKSSTMAKSWHNILPQLRQVGPREELAELVEFEKVINQSPGPVAAIAQAMLKPAIDNVNDFEESEQLSHNEDSQMNSDEEEEEEETTDDGRVVKINCGNCSNKMLSVVRQAVKSGKKVTICIHS